MKIDENALMLFMSDGRILMLVESTQISSTFDFLWCAENATLIVTGNHVDDLFVLFVVLGLCVE